MKSSVKIGLIGCGTVGTGLVKILRKNSAQISARVGQSVELAWLCDLRRPQGTIFKGPRFTKNWRDLVKDPDLDIVVELIGGYEPARTMILTALEHGKHVVTANKAVLSKHWGEVNQAALASRCLIYFEASVGGGIPVVQGLNEGLAANRVEKILGILNGTTNYVLSRMEEGQDYASALQAAQRAGFAEADPTFDVEGTDAAHKIAVLASLAAGGWVKFSWVQTEGISRLDVKDIMYVKKFFGYVVRLLAICKFKKAGIEIRVHPTALPSSHPFASVKDEYNAIFIYGDAVGDVMFYGKGAGQMAAASAVASDVIFLARQVVEGVAGKLPYVPYSPHKKLAALPPSQVQSKYYLRFMTKDRPGVLSRIAGILGENGVSISAVHQPEGTSSSNNGVPILIITHLSREGSVQKSLQEIKKLESVCAKPVLLRIEE